MTRILIVLLVYGGVFTMSELGKRRFRVSAENTRLVVHVLAGLVATILPFILSRNAILGLAAVFTIALWFSKKAKILTSIHEVKRTSWGEVLFPPAIGLAAWLYLPDQPGLYVLSLLLLSISDAAANLIGRLPGPKLLFGKSAVGSIAFFVTAIPISLFFISWPSAILVASLATVAEAISPRGTDNMTIILCAAILLLLK